MKHTLSITIIIVLLFLLSQVIGLYALNVNTKVTQTPEGGMVVEHEETVIGERPQIEGPVTFIYIIIAVLIGTGLILILIKLKKIKIWKALYFFAVWMTCSITIGVFIDNPIVFILGFILALLKIFRHNVWIHNLTELLVYAGIAIIFVPLLDVFWVSMLLLVISAYDMFAVWKSKHMVSLAEFQTKSRAFAGLLLSYKLKLKAEKIKKPKAGKEVKEEYRNAVLGGGDIAFPMLFAGAVMDTMIKMGVHTKIFAFLYSMIIPITVAVILFALLVKARSDRFYPAMPFLTIGCFVGYGLVWLINFV